MPNDDIWIDPPQCMPDEYKVENDSIKAYVMLDIYVENIKSGDYKTKVKKEAVEDVVRTRDALKTMLKSIELDDCTADSKSKKRR